MTMRRINWAAVALLVGCTDYDLSRSDEVEPPGTEETEPEPEPSEDPDILVEPLSLDFGSVLKDCPGETFTVTVTNEGKGQLEVSDIYLSGDGVSAFQQTGGPLSLAYKESATFEVSFTPLGWLSYDVDVVVESNDPDEGKVRVDALGEGARGALYEEGFTQDYNELVDVLWVVDNSCSMEDELATMASNFNSFISQFSALDLDYHIAVVTTDMDNPDDSGRFQGEVLTPDTPNLLAKFADQVNQGNTGSASEQGFLAVKTALSEPLLSSTNAGFLREEAGLTVIVVSDENDDSSLNSSNFTTWFKGLKPKDPTLARFNAFCGDRFLGCVDPFNSGISATGGDKYIDAVDLTGGFFSSICSSDYSIALQELSITAAGMTVTFYLTEEPATLSDMTVVVNGTALSQDSDTGWTYDPENNSITFHGDSIPGPGEDVQVSYTVAGECAG